MTYISQLANINTGNSKVCFEYDFTITGKCIECKSQDFNAFLFVYNQTSDQVVYWPNSNYTATIRGNKLYFDADSSNMASTDVFVIVYDALPNQQMAQTQQDILSALLDIKLLLEMILD